MFLLVTYIQTVRNQVETSKEMDGTSEAGRSWNATLTKLAKDNKTSIVVKESGNSFMDAIKVQISSLGSF